MELLAGIEPADLILTKDALCRLSYSSMSEQTALRYFRLLTEFRCASLLLLRRRKPALPGFAPSRAGDAIETGKAFKQWRPRTDSNRRPPA